MLSKLAQLVRKLLELTPPEPKAVLKLIKVVPEQRLDVNIKLVGGEIIHFTKKGKTDSYYVELDLGPGFHRQAKFLWLLNQNGLTINEYNELYIKEFINTQFDQPYHYNQERFIELAPGTVIEVNPRYVISSTFIENNSNSVQVVEHKVKNE